MQDLISRQAAINALTSHIMPHNNEDGTVTIGVLSKSSIKNILNKLPSAQPETHEERTETHACDCISRSAQPERLTDDDFETIRIHLNAYKEKLCNQHRWEEADEYQRIIDRFMAFASAQLEIIRCKACRWRDDYGHWLGCPVLNTDDDNFCSRAERRTDE